MDQEMIDAITCAQTDLNVFSDWLKEEWDDLEEPVESDPDFQAVSRVLDIIDQLLASEGAH